MTKTNHPVVSAVAQGFCVAWCFLLACTAPAVAQPPANKQVPQVDLLQLGEIVKSTLQDTAGSSSTSSQSDKAQLSIQQRIASRWVYATDRYQGQSGMFLVLHELSRSNNESAGSISETEVAYPFHLSPDFPTAAYFTGHTVREPQFSPDGRYVLFKFVNYGEIQNAYLLWVLDTQTNTLKIASGRSLAYTVVSWSPDGNYIAYIQGGDYKGEANFALFNSNIYIGPLTLYVCNWRTGQEQEVESNDTLAAPFSWIAPHTLLYADLSVQDQNALTERMEGGKQSAIQNPEPLPDVYAFSVEKHQARVLISDASRAAASPDGKRIAFYGPENLAKPFPLRGDWQIRSNSGALSIVSSDGTSRVALNREDGFYPAICWLPDNRHLLTIQQVKESPDAEAEVKEWSADTQTFRQVAILHAKDYRAFPFSLVSPKFRPVSISPDGATFFVSVFEAVQAAKGGFVTTQTVQAVDLKTGAITIVGQAPFRFDWHDASTPPFATLSVPAPPAN